ncbi:ornithine cyclodeaminase/mu-crystallin [Solidesulfovibrio carbinoliphilus subsp. oakridgensis]|uniref:Ornithine cyclodeaminase/mu-crystallin n=1 Tax=Solidesulfovibrio carbinoliphilus subsp. oakridgensis TaxID=694327 RepID=G7Q687_9BACT|nr:delta(1)-pyrroline-2-carboxylate reductase family protein [Solidesulfovibrio carbinoliphilus]EHJ47260.1 ornithine cyclodeaminase/mu-crystallin [Solidesulfovibrio carbinoliphilus subsp. oakridgensis]
MGDVAGLFPYDALADAVAEVLRARRAGRAIAPERLAMPVPGGVLLCMPAADEALAVVKTITVHPGNGERGLPVIQGEVTVMEAATGRRLGVLDGPTVTARRTAAVSLLAARLLAPAPAGPLLVIGAGVQARAHVEAFRQGLGVREIWLASRTRDRAEGLARDLAGRGVAVRVAADPAAMAQAAATAGLIVTATTSREPVLPDAVRGDVFVSAVGSFTPEAAEIPAALVRRAALFVDDRASARVEAGDFLRAGVDWDTVTDLTDVLDKPPRPSGPVVFKTVGHALFDLAAARQAFAGRF